MRIRYVLTLAVLATSLLIGAPHAQAHDELPCSWSDSTVVVPAGHKVYALTLTPGTAWATDGADSTDEYYEIPASGATLGTGYYHIDGNQTMSRPLTAGITSFTKFTGVIRVYFFADKDTHVSVRKYGPGCARAYT